MSKFGLSFLAKALAGKSELTQAEAEVFIKQMFDVINHALDSDKQLKVRWLGTFKVTSTKDRESIDVNTGERILIEGRDKLSFTPDSILKELVNKPFAQFETVVVNDGVDFAGIDEKFELQERAEAEVKDDAAAATETDIETEESVGDVVLVADEDLSFVESSETKISDEVVVIGDDKPTFSVQPESVPTEEQHVKESSVEEQAPIETQIAEELKDTEIKEIEELQSAGEQQVEEKQQVADVPQITDEQHATEKQQVSAPVAAKKRHVSIPRYMVAVVSVLIFIMVGGLCWFAYNYGKMAAQRDHLTSQLVTLKQQNAIQQQKRSVEQAKAKEQESLRQKALADSIRMAQASEAVTMAEQANELNGTPADKPAPEKVEKRVDAPEPNLSKETYDKDPRVRTGAYRIVGVAQTVTVKEGQTLASISKRYLGEGMECYVEALNGTSHVKAGQQLKIPKLKMKKK